MAVINNHLPGSPEARAEVLAAVKHALRLADKLEFAMAAIHLDQARNALMDKRDELRSGEASAVDVDSAGDDGALGKSVASDRSEQP